MRLPTLLGEPLVQFLAIGALVAGLYALVPDAPVEIAPDDAADTIVVTGGQIEQLRRLFGRTWQRPPTPDELDGLIEAHVREEVLYHAGRALGLDEDDAVVRRRIAQKMEFLMEPAPGELVPTDAELARHLAAYPDRFAEPARVAFEQVFFDPARRGDAVSGDVAAVRAALSGGADPGGLGDPTLLPAAVGLGPVGNVARLFGEPFANALLEAPVGEWTGPVRSAFGVHVVRVARRMPAREPSLEAARAAIRADWESVRGREVARERLEEMIARYRIVVERPPAAHPDEAAESRSPAADR